MKKWILGIFFGFIATVSIPMKETKVYKNVVRVDCFGNVGEPTAYYLLKLDNGKQVYVPILFTIIEEK